MNQSVQNNETEESYQLLLCGFFYSVLRNSLLETIPIFFSSRQLFYEPLLVKCKLHRWISPEFQVIFLFKQIIIRTYLFVCRSRDGPYIEPGLPTPFPKSAKQERKNH